MSVFKFKPEKTRYTTNIKTLDETHNNIIGEFQKKRNNLPLLNAKLDKLINQLDKLENKSPTKLNMEDAQFKSKLKTEIASVRESIREIESGEQELDYYAKTYDILIDYYDSIDLVTDDLYEINPELSDKKQITTPTVNKLEILNNMANKNVKQIKPVKKRKKEVINYSKNNIMNMLISTSPTTNNNIISVSPNESASHVPIIDKSKLYDEYKQLISNDYFDKTHATVRQNNHIKKCPNCNIIKKLIQSEAIFVCTNCGDTETIIIESENGSFKDAAPEKAAYPYKRKNHFCEWLSQFQAKESTEIPQDVYDKLKLEIKKNRITNLKRDLNRNKIKGYLKKLGLVNYYEHIPHIMSKLTGLPPPTINRETEETLRMMFNQIQEPFNKHRPPGRVNFLSYSYCLNKFCELLELDEFLKDFPLLKSPEKLKEQDKIWKKICQELKWEFYASI